MTETVEEFISQISNTVADELDDAVDEATAEGFSSPDHAASVIVTGRLEATVLRAFNEGLAAGVHTRVVNAAITWASARIIGKSLATLDAETAHTYLGALIKLIVATRAEVAEELFPGRDKYDLSVEVGMPANDNAPAWAKNVAGHA